jgi:SAM-dependent methyltransferase
MDHPHRDFLEQYYCGSYWAFKHYEKIVSRAFGALHRKPKVGVEVGCGDGMATFFLSGQVDQLICLDTNEKCIEKVETMAREMGLKNVTFRKAALDRISLDEEVDLIFLKDVLHHMESPADYLRSCLPFSSHLLIVEANRYNPLLYWICKRLAEEKLFLKMNALPNILRLVKQGGWRPEKSFYVESAAYPIGFCLYHDVYPGKRAVKRIMEYLGKAYDWHVVASLVDKIEVLAEKIFKPFSSEFIIVARKESDTSSA